MSSVLVRQVQGLFPNLAYLPHSHLRSCILCPLSLPRYAQSLAISSTYRPGQVTPYGLLLHQLQSDVDVKLAAILDIFMAAQGMLTGGVGRQDHECLGTQWEERHIL